MKTVEVLTAAKELIKDPANWFQGDYTKELEDGNTCYCALGAIGKVIGADWWVAVHNNEAHTLLKEVVAVDIKTGETFAPYNDSHTHSEVMEAFDKAIELAKARE